MLAAVGALVQLVGVVLLAVLLLVLRRYADVRGYFGPWTLGWACYALGLAAIVTRYVLGPQLGATLGPTAAEITDAVYVAGKFLFYVALCSGAARFAGRPGPMGKGAVAVLFFGVVAFELADDLNLILVWQAPLAAAASVAAARMLFHPQSRRATIGSVVTGTTCYVLGALWVLYGVAFLPAVRERQVPMFVFLNSYNSFVDLLVAMALGFGMIVLVLEDAKHAADRAHAELVEAHAALRRIAAQDALTGALNRSAFREAAALGTALPGGALVLVDLDDLKRVNDTLGHAAGDRLLALLAMTLRRGLPEASRLYRWGGDEFVVVMPDAEPGRTARDVAGILESAEPMRVGTIEVPLAASIGESAYVDGADLEAAVARADASMYHDKGRRKSGRNLLAVAG